MERELWSWITRAIRDVSRSHRDSNAHTHSTATVVRTYLWAVLHDRPTAWACDRRAWDDRTRPPRLPSQPTMSRRLRTDAAAEFLYAVGRRLSSAVPSDHPLFKAIDGKPLAVSAHSRDRDATWGYGAGKRLRGYKLHLIDSGKPMPAAFDIQPMSVAEDRVAEALIPTLTGAGYLLADASYDNNRLYLAAAEVGHRFVAPRRKPYTGLKTWPRSNPHRLAAIATLETHRWGGNRLGPQLMKLRRSIETTFGNLTGFAAGLTHLPPWVRGLTRVKTYVHAKLIINAARIRRLRE